MIGALFTVIDAIALLPSAVAAMFARPTLRAETTPALETVAMVVSLLDQNTSIDDGLPCTSASSDSVPPTFIVALGGVSAIPETVAASVTDPPPQAPLTAKAARVACAEARVMR